MSIVDRVIAELVAEKDKVIGVLMEEVHLLKLENAELKRRLGLDSSNSSKPPSSDGLKRPNRTTSLRKGRDKDFGGQKGHQGKTLVQVEDPDVIEQHPVDHCQDCGNDLRSTVAASFLKRQVFDVEIRRVVTEHQAAVKFCACGTRNTGAFPCDVQAPTQIGPTLKAIALYLSGQFIPHDRLSEVMASLFGTPISDTTLLKYEAQLSQALAPFYEQTLEALKTAELKHLDETGIRVGGKTCWMHVICDAQLTHLRSCWQRKDLLPGLKGTAVHDHYPPYQTISGVAHAFCNAHHLRELKALKEIEKEEWAQGMYSLLQRMGAESHEPSERWALAQQYDSLLEQGLKYHESLPPLRPPAKARGRPPRRTGHNLLLRLKNYKTETLRFLFEEGVPFTNNQAERDLRMVKVKLKVSGGWRQETGPQHFARIRSFISTAQKNGHNILQAIKLALAKTVTLQDILATT